MGKTSSSSKDLNLFCSLFLRLKKRFARKRMKNTNGASHAFGRSKSPSGVFQRAVGKKLRYEHGADALAQSFFESERWCGAVRVWVRQTRHKWTATRRVLFNLGVPRGAAARVGCITDRWFAGRRKPRRLASLGGRGARRLQHID